jgi:maltose alpha-D-glucosyltransferase / alpha-amylase
VALLDLWYKDAVIYCLDVEYFADSNGDGIGDFKGLTERLDYLAGIGVTCLWLLPFYVSPNRDNGYDISDFYSVDPRHGSLGDFVEFSHQARQRGMRVIIDLVVNHTSDQHPWFQAARQDRNSKYFPYYVWSEKKPPDAHSGMVFPGVQKSTWTYDKQARAYYFHRFYEFQPDLNVGNPEVREEILKIMGFWLELGVSGFRMDAVPFLVEKQSLQYEPLELNSKQPAGEAKQPLVGDLSDPMNLFTGLRDFLSWRSRDAILLAEANLPMDVITGYFGQNDRIHMIFNFLLNQHVWLALATEQAEPIARVMSAAPQLSHMSQWANFLRNHDEIDLGRLSDEERQAVFARCGPDPEMQLYNRGIRRRLAPMLGGDKRLIELAFSLMFTLPGTPVIWYGDEIGMGDDLRQPEREGLRMPMQWANKSNGGFSTAPPNKLVKPVIKSGPYSYEHVNVADQRRDPKSLLNWMERIIRTRKECRELGWGQAHLLNVKEPSVLAQCVEWEGSVVLTVHNLATEAREVELDLSQYSPEQLVDLLGDREVHQVIDGTCKLLLDGYGYRWFRLNSRYA